MSIEIMKKAVIGAASAIALLGAASAQALTLDPVSADGQNYTFSGTTDLAYGSITASCTLELSGYIDSGSETITITNNDVSGPYPCTSVNISNLDVGDVTNVTSSGGEVTFTGVDVTVATFFQCNDGTVVADFHNDGSNPSYFTIDQQGFGNCTLATDNPLTIVPADSYSSDVNVSP
ncbi:hypothetical protein Y5W_03135 [Alcanivorax sp. 521-1]|uniref:Uncharacterized protein n=1 Tax=Alloalcanivorax profundimaris TaxID=2735259 RepID=A0ABS0AUN6_9GAMM|nr:hypothetical protein [Alloalcanivorax profundimaris]MBF5057841.1 hypothetical protein [Alloalcanivorax profundimaris]